MDPAVKRRLEKRLRFWRGVNPPANPQNITDLLFEVARGLVPQPTRAEMDSFIQHEGLPPCRGHYP